MKLPITFSKYLLKQYLSSFFIVASCIGFIITIFDTIEILRKSQDKHIPIRIIFDLVFLKIPYLMIELLPFIILISTILTFARLTRNSELIVARASGISVWQFLVPALTVSLSVGIFVVTILNPLSAIFLNKLDSITNKYFSNNINVFSVSSTGLWLKQQDANYNNGGKIVIHALSLEHKSSNLENVTFYAFDTNNELNYRIYAKKASLSDGKWLIPSGIINYTSENNTTSTIENYTIPTTIKIYEVLDSYFPPENISFWNLPSFIKVLNDAGFSAIRHNMYWHKILEIPLLLSAMVLFATIFSLRIPRKGRTGVLISLGLISGFIVKMLNDIIYALGLSRQIPTMLAVWGPVIIIILISCAIILHLEDG